MPEQNTNYIHGCGSIFTRKHPSLNYGQTGAYATDASCREGYAWFMPSADDYNGPAMEVNLSNIFTRESTYVDGTEA